MEFNWQGPWNLAVDQGCDVGERNFLPTLSLFLPARLPVLCPLGARREPPRSRGPEALTWWEGAGSGEETRRQRERPEAQPAVGLGRAPGLGLASGQQVMGLWRGEEPHFFPPRHRTTLQTGFQKTRLPVHWGWPWQVTVQRPLRPISTQLWAALTRVTSLEVWHQRAAGSVERKGLGWHKAEGHEAGEWGASSPGGKGHGTDTEVG